MALADVVSSYTGGEGGRRVVHTEAAAPLAQALQGSSPVDGGTGDGTGVGAGDGPFVLVDLAQRGHEAAALDTGLEAVGPHDVLVLLLVSLPEDLPVGPLVDVATRAGARVVRVEGLRTRHARTVLVVTRDEEVPAVSYLLGHAVPRDDAALRRLANEWQLEGVQLRALTATLERRLEGAVAESAALRVAKASVESRLADQAREHARTVSALERRLASGGSGLGPRLRRAARTISSDPVGGSKKVARAVARKASR